MGYNSKQLQPEQICPVFLAFLTQICTQITTSTSTIAHKIRVFSCLKTLGFPTGCFSCVSQRKNTRFPSFCCLACLSRIVCFFFFCVKHSNFCRVFSVCFPRRKHVCVPPPPETREFQVDKPKNIFNKVRMTLVLGRSEKIYFSNGINYIL